MENILSTHNLCKRYGMRMAVDNVNISINKGDIYGFVGLNGSGKTTFIRLITSLIKPTAGSFTLFGEKDNPTKALSRISSMVETPSIYLNMTAEDNLRTQCLVSGLDYTNGVKELLEMVGLQNTGGKKAKNFSLGMKQRLGIAIALIGSPSLMMLDEPTNGLDPEGIVEIRELLLKLNKDFGMTILVSSHILTELSKLATRYGFIHHGKLIKEATSEEVLSNYNKKIVVTVDNLIGAMSALNGIMEYKVVNSSLEIDASIPFNDIVNVLYPAGIQILNTRTQSADLEHYFMNLIGGGQKR